MVLRKTALFVVGSRLFSARLTFAQLFWFLSCRSYNRRRADDAQTTRNDHKPPVFTEQNCSANSTREHWIFRDSHVARKCSSVSLKHYSVQRPIIARSNVILTTTARRSSSSTSDGCSRGKYISLSRIIATTRAEFETRIRGCVSLQRGDIVPDIAARDIAARHFRESPDEESADERRTIRCGHSTGGITHPEAGLWPRTSAFHPSRSRLRTTSHTMVETSRNQLPRAYYTLTHAREIRKRALI